MSRNFLQQDLVTDAASFVSWSRYIAGLNGIWKTQSDHWIGHWLKIVNVAFYLRERKRLLNYPTFFVWSVSQTKWRGKSELGSSQRNNTEQNESPSVQICQNGAYLTLQLAIKSCHCFIFHRHQQWMQIKLKVNHSSFYFCLSSHSKKNCSGKNSPMADLLYLLLPPGTDCYWYLVSLYIVLKR